jgi:hypothetical protein
MQVEKHHQAESGDSFIYSAQKGHIERNIPAGEESLIYKHVDLFQPGRNEGKGKSSRGK